MVPIAALLAAPRAAHANPDPPSLDPRSNAMGGGGTTFAQGAAGLGINPALMQYSDRGDAIVSGYVLSTGVHAPVTGPGANNQSSVTTPGRTGAR